MSNEKVARKEKQVGRIRINDTYVVKVDDRQFTLVRLVEKKNNDSIEILEENDRYFAYAEGYFSSMFNLIKYLIKVNTKTKIFTKDEEITFKQYIQMEKEATKETHVLVKLMKFCKMID